MGNGRVFGPEVEGSVRTGRGEGSMRRVERECVYAEDICGGGGSNGILAVAFKGEVHAALIMSVSRTSPQPSAS